MYKTLALLMSLVLIAGCSQVDQNELLAGEKIGLNKNDLVTIKKISGTKVEAFTRHYKQYAGLEGITIPVKFNETERVNESLRDIFKERGYLVFLAEQNYEMDDKDNILAMVKSVDTYDILRIQNTNYIEHNITTAQLIEILKDMEKRYNFSFQITGAEPSWLEADLSRLPQPMDKFTEELTLLSPELLNDGTGRIEDLQAGIEESGKVYILLY